MPKKIAKKMQKKNLFKGLQVWLQMAPNGCMRLQMVINVSKSHLKKFQRSQTVPSSFNFFFKCQKWLRLAKKCQKVNKAKEYNNRKIPESTTLYLLKIKYMLKMFKRLQTAQNGKTQEYYKGPKSDTTYTIKKCQKVPKGAKKLLI